MGQLPSSFRAREEESNETPRCYYEILNISMDATEQELKKAYRRQALILHPDKNPDDTVGAAARFAELQAAYEVLSDAQERAWYDRNRTAILRQRMVSESSSSSTNAPSIDDLLVYFDSKAFRGFDDQDERSFFVVYRELFEKISLFEEQWDVSGGRMKKAQRPVTFFGKSNDRYEIIKPFYDYWMSFQSKRSFEDHPEVCKWLHYYGVGRQLDRYNRRQLEKEAAKVEENLRRQFSERIRELAVHVRRRDPRYKSWMKQKELERTEAEQRRKEQMKKTRRTVMEDFELPEWAQSAESFINTRSDDDDEEEEIEALFCVACKKSFMTVGQWRNHEQSKKHRKTLQSKGIDPDTVDDVSDFDQSESDINTCDVSDEYQSELDVNICDVSDECQSKDVNSDINIDISIDVSVEESINVEMTSDTPEDILEDLDTANVIDVLERLKVSSHTSKDDNEIHRKEPRKKRRAEKIQKTSSIDPSLVCRICKQPFESRNALFKHISNTGHAIVKR